MKELIDWYQTGLDSNGYWFIALLMAMESTIVPIPSELVIPFAAQRAHLTGHLSLWGIALAGAVGSVIGASIMYWVARWAGRPLVLRYGKYFLVPEEKLHAAERWCARFGSFGVFVARLLPVVRHLIGLPMGIVKMDFQLYTIFTLLGSAIWCSVLTFVGVVAGKDEALMRGDLRQIMVWLLAFIFVIGGLYFFFVHRHMKKTA
ncbi:MAG TPA: DedA family protein [Verrucomicrobiae bacterium]|nr:DedA family protein [Verrucomicrobiae bacterium]